MGNCLEHIAISSISSSSSSSSSLSSSCLLIRGTCGDNCCRSYYIVYHGRRCGHWHRFQKRPKFQRWLGDLTAKVVLRSDSYHLLPHDLLYARMLINIHLLKRKS